MYLKPGNTGLLVKNCQYSLHILTYNVNGIDGSYGPGMESAVQLYQKNNGLAVSGIIDTATWNNIVANIYPIKLQLSHKGYYNYYTLDGIGNIDLYNAVKNFQSDNGLAVDGMVGPATRVKLYSEGTGNTVVGDDEFPLVQGDKGDNVLYLQYGLHVLACAPGALDGSFGPAVDTAVRYFQGRYGLAVDGSVGPATWNKMKELITEIQQALYNFNDPDVKISIINGIAGPETYNAVCFFQAKVGLSVDGSVGPATRAILFSDSSGSTRPADGLPLTSGCTGLLVKKFQYGLHICGINPNGFDGSFGPGMLSAVQTFQSKYGLSVDGSVGPATWNKMLEIIKPIQQALKTAGYYLYDVNGEPDEILYNSLISYQSAHGLSADGMFGPETKASLGITGNTSTSTGTGTVSSVLVKGSNGSLVRYLQKLLQLEGYILDVDGSFGPAMETVVMQFQREHGLNPDGSFGPASWETLFTYYTIPTLGDATGGECVARAAEYELSLGFSEDNANDITPYGEWYGMNGQPWCAMFVSWCAWQAGYLDEENLPKYAYCPYGKSWFVERNRYMPRNTGYIPKRGDIIFFWDGGTISHTGIVVGSTNMVVTVIEGNASRMVKKSMYDLTNTYIDGYGIFKKDYIPPLSTSEKEDLAVKAFEDFLDKIEFTYSGSLQLDKEISMQLGILTLTAAISLDTDAVIKEAVANDFTEITISNGSFVYNNTILDPLIDTFFMGFEGLSTIPNIAFTIGVMINNGTLYIKLDDLTDPNNVNIEFVFEQVVFGRNLLTVSVVYSLKVTIDAGLWNMAYEVAINQVKDELGMELDWATNVGKIALLTVSTLGFFFLACGGIAGGIVEGITGTTAEAVQALANLLKKLFTLLHNQFPELLPAI